MQEIAIRVRIREQEQLGLGEYERIVGSVATVAALIAWLPAPDERLVLRGRGSEPARVETVTHGTDFEMLVVLDQRALATARAAGVVAALVEAARAEPGSDVAGSETGVAGEIDRLDRLAPRGRTVAERGLRTFLEAARADVIARRATTRVRAASALVRLAEEGAELTVERIDDARAEVVTATVVADAAPDAGDTVVIAETADEASIMADAPVVGSVAPSLSTPPKLPLPSAASAKSPDDGAGSKDKKSEKKSDKKSKDKKSDKKDKKSDKKAKDKKSDKKDKKSDKKRGKGGSKKD